MRRAFTAASVVIAATFTLAACATGAPMPAESSSSSPRPSFQTTTPGAVGPTGTPADVPAAQWTAIQEDLVSRGVTGTAEVVSSEQVTFSDGSLGCAEPGQSYTQALVDGMRVIVSVDGTSYDYRLGEGNLVLCTR